MIADHTVTSDITFEGNVFQFDTAFLFQINLQYEFVCDIPNENFVVNIINNTFSSIVGIAGYAQITINYDSLNDTSTFQANVHDNKIIGGDPAQAFLSFSGGENTTAIVDNLEVDQIDMSGSQFPLI